MIFNMVGGSGGGSGGGGAQDTVPVLGTDFTYTGNCTVIDDSDAVLGTQWRIKFLTSGTLTTSKEWLVDLFLVGGGASGAAGTSNRAGGAGGNGGECKTVSSLTVDKQIGIGIVVGGIGGDTSALGQTAIAGGGAVGGALAAYNNDGNPGGAGTYEFNSVSGDMYGGAGGGGGGGVQNESNPSNAGGAGGAGGGGDGGAGGGKYGGIESPYGRPGSSCQANTGGGGGGGGGGQVSTGAYVGAGGSGGSGIVIMRKHKE